MELFSHFKYLVIVSVSFVVLAIVMKFSFDKSSIDIKGNPIFKGTLTDASDIDKILAQITNLQLRSEQELNPLLSLIYTSYAIGCFHILEGHLLKQYTPDQLQKLFRLDTKELHTFLESHQSKMLEQIKCKVPLALSNDNLLPSSYAIQSCI